MPEIAVSVLDVDKEDSVKTFYNIETAKTDYFHIDVADGRFVEKNNLLQMKDYTMEIHTISMTPIDVHLMVEKPMDMVDYFIEQGADRITFHYEACRDSKEILKNIRYLVENGVKVGIAISPSTDIRSIYEFLPYIHMVLIMSVEPGKGGQKFILETINKIKNLKKYCEENDIDIDIEIDGGINDTSAKECIKAGASILVAGVYVVKSDDYIKSIKLLKGEEV